MVAFKYDETCDGWNRDPNWCELFLLMQRDYLNEKLKYRGYVYLNEIFESFGAKWNPDDDNLCYRIECWSIEMDFEKLGDGTYLVKIY